MHSLEIIKKMNNKKAGRLYKAVKDKDEGVFKCPKIEDISIKGYKQENEFFVDNSGFGKEGELALTIGQFISKIKEGLYYGITEAGQFQVYIGEYRKI